jgi:serralysin
MPAAVLLLPTEEELDTLTGGETSDDGTQEDSSSADSNQPPAPPSPPPILYKDLTELNDNESLTIGDLAGFSGGLRALSGNDLVRGSSDNEKMNGNAGLDTLLGGNGEDILLGGRDSDRVFGEEGNDILNGNRGKDLVVGGEDNDFVRGGQDEDVLIGSAGNDTLVGDFGQDLLFGGTGEDLYVLRTDAAETDPNQADLIFGFSATEDNIGLTDGMTANDIALELFTIDITTQLSIFDLFPDQTSVVPTFSTQLVNPEDQTTVNATVEGVLIRNNQANSEFFGSALGIVIGATPAEISDRFITVSDDVLALG